MKHTKQYGVLLLSLLFLCACGDSNDVVAPDAVQVTETLRVSVVPMETLGTAATRTEEEAESKSLQVSYVPTKATRADIDKTAAEKEIKSAYVVLFNGTAPTSTVTWVSENVAASLNSTGSIACNLMLTGSAKNRVYVVANPQSAPTVGTTLQKFETISYTVTTALPTTGLPMAAFQDVALGETLGLFQLKSPLARLTFTTNTGTLTLHGIPSAYSLATSVAGATAVRPSGITYTNTASLTSGTAYYVPANLSGQVSLPSSIFRCSLFAPANSMYVVISANSTTYNIYLGDSTPSDFNVVSNMAYAVNATVNGTDNTVDYRVGTPTSIDLSAMGTAIDLSAAGTANCYIATQPNKLYSFNAKVMGNGATTPAHTAGSISGDQDFPAIVPTALNPVSADVLWETWNTNRTPMKGSVAFLVSYANDKIYVYTGSDQGNAVVAARDASNNILWSWHIWRINNDPTLAANTATTTDYTSTYGTFDATGKTTHPGFTMMKLNLGALSSTAGDNLSTGLHYQWGRKDPMPAYAGLTAPNDIVMATTPAGIPVIPGAEAQSTVAQSIAQPTTFFKGGDWCSTRNDNLWGTPLTKTVISSDYNSNLGSKSIYDPCPAGWRVPPAYVYVNATSSNCPWDETNKMGRDFKGIFISGTSVWFPASGNRYNHNGTLNGVGSYSYYWAATPSAYLPARGHLLYFDSSRVGLSNNGIRGSGCALRCAKE